jgi:hypothetical protein
MILASVWRDSATYVDRYASQVAALREKEDVKVVAVEGDSRDNTFDLLTKQAFYHVLRCEHGGPSFESKNNPQRWRQISLPCNVAMTAAIRLSEGREPIVYVESDLIWTADMIHGLVHDLEKVPAVAPMCFRWSDPTMFYDRWGYKGLGGTDFGHYPPWLPGLANTLVKIDSCGSCFALRAELAPYVEFSTQDLTRGVGRSIRAAGADLWLDPQLAVYHP